jgi:hypothetical protein
MFLLTFIELDKYLFYLMSEITLCYRRDNVQAKCSKLRKLEGEVRSATNAHGCCLVCKMKLSMTLYNVTVQ